MVRLYDALKTRLCGLDSEILAQEQRCGFLDYLRASERPRRSRHGVVNRSLCCGRYAERAIDEEDGGRKLCGAWGPAGPGYAQWSSCPAASLEIELIAITKCEDRLRQSALLAYRSTQSYDFLIVNCGLHSMHLRSRCRCLSCEADEYAQDLQGYLSLLSSLAKHVVWLTTSATLDGERRFIC